MKSPERKHLLMRILHNNINSRSKDWNKNEFHFMWSAMKNNANTAFLIL